MEAARAAGPGSDCRAAGRLRGTAVAGGAQHRPHRRRTVRNRGARRALTTMSAPQVPGVFATLAPVLDHYGYLVVGGTLFIQNLGWPVSLGQTIFIAGAIYAGAGRLNIVILAVIGIVVSVMGGVVGYVIGRSGGRAPVHRYGRYVFLTGERFAKAEAFFTRRGAFLIIIARFFGVAKQTFGLIAGITKMPFLRFLLCNTL